MSSGISIKLFKQTKSRTGILVSCAIPEATYVAYYSHQNTNKKNEYKVSGSKQILLTLKHFSY